MLFAYTPSVGEGAILVLVLFTIAYLGITLISAAVFGLIWLILYLFLPDRIYDKKQFESKYFLTTNSLILPALIIIKELIYLSPENDPLALHKIIYISILTLFTVAIYLFAFPKISKRKKLVS